MATIKVLVADDDQGIRELLTLLISMERGIDLVGAARDAQEAIDIAARAQPDVALLDVRMPAGGGVRAAREIKAAHPSCAIVALSGADDRDIVLAMLSAGARSYVLKSRSMTGIAGAVRDAARGVTSLSPSIATGVVDELAGRLAVRERDQAWERVRTERIRRALQGRMHMVFQPVFDLASGRAAGYEALARFTLDPRRPPDEWFAEAGQLGLRVALEAAAVARALDGMRLLPPDAFLSVNVSPGVLGSPQVASLLEEAAGARLAVEVTEHEPVPDYGPLLGALGNLRDAGVRVAVDDAGAGFSSMRHALLLAPDIIKVDTSIVEGIEHDPRRRALAAAIVRFALQIDASVVAEGVENAAQVEVLTELGVRYAQGYHLGRPAELAAAPLAGAV